MITFFAAKKGTLYSQLKTKHKKTWTVAQEIFFEKFRLQLKKVRKATRPFIYDLNQISYDYTVEVTNTFKRLDLVDRLKNYRQKFIILHRRE